MRKAKKIKLPEMFRPLMWSYRFSEIDAESDKRVIIVNAINYGDLPHWRWLVNYYGRAALKAMLSDIPFSEFRTGAIKLMGLFLGFNKLNYASRSDYIQGRRTFVCLGQI